jgi:hypothetical protein
VADVDRREVLLLPGRAQVDEGGLGVPPEVEALVHLDLAAHGVDGLDLSHDVRGQADGQGDVGHRPAV